MGKSRVVILISVLAAVALGCSAEGEPDAAATVPSTEATLLQPAETTTTTTPVAEGPDPTCSYAGTDPDFGDIQIDLTFANTVGAVNGLDVTYALLDGDGGSRFITASEDITLPMANEQFRMSVSPLEDLPPNINEATIDCRVLAVEEGLDIGGFERATETDTCAVLGVDPNGDTQVEVAVTNPFENTATLQTWWAVQAPGAVRYDTGTEVVDLVGAGEAIKISGLAFGAPEWAADGEVTCTVLGFWDQG